MCSTIACSVPSCGFLKAASNWHKTICDALRQVQNCKNTIIATATWNVMQGITRIVWFIYQSILMLHYTVSPPQYKLYVRVRASMVHVNRPGPAYQSMGCMITGMDTRPTPVASHRRNCWLSTRVACLFSRNLLAAHSLLMVSPGITTDARPCHSNVSNTAALGDTALFWLCESWFEGFGT